jgi:hypothetical protein
VRPYAQCASMMLRVCALCLVILAALPFSAPFSTCGPADLFMANGIDECSSDALIHVSAAPQGHNLAIGDCPTIPRPALIVATAVHNPEAAGLRHRSFVIRRSDPRSIPVPQPTLRI